MRGYRGGIVRFDPLIAPRICGGSGPERQEHSVPFVTSSFARLAICSAWSFGTGSPAVAGDDACCFRLTPRLLLILSVLVTSSHDTRLPIDVDAVQIGIGMILYVQEKDLSVCLPAYQPLNAGLFQVLNSMQGDLI